jgi:hypothetical protein
MWATSGLPFPFGSALLLLDATRDFTAARVLQTGTWKQLAAAHGK